MYETEITPEGLRHLDRLPEKARTAALESNLGPIADDPQRPGTTRLRGQIRRR